MSPEMDAYAIEGWCLLQDVVSPDEVQAVSDDLTAAVAQGARAHGMRDVLQRAPAARVLAHRLAGLASRALGGNVRMIRGLLLDKTAAANWHVPWHQDATVAFAARREVAGFVRWSVKAGVAHAQPPEPWLTRRVALRVHLDPCPADAGPLRVLPGTHRRGVLDADAMASLGTRVPPITVLAMLGDVLVMHPLLLHASAPAERPGRRVLHLEYVDAALPLPDGLAWAEAP